MEYSQLVPASLKPRSPNFCDLVDCFLHVNDDFRKEIFAVLAWCLWNRRNALHIGRVVQPIANISSMACNLLQEFLVAQEEDDLPGHLPPTQHQWRPPEQGYFKVNYDAAVFKTLNLAGVGVIICDWRGEVTAALSMPVPIHDHSWPGSSSLPPSCDVYCWKWSSQRYFRRGFSFSDQRHLSGERSVDFFWEYCGRYSRFSFYFPVFQFVHVHRTCNVVADALAKKAKNLVGIQVWSGVLPEDISQLVGFDVSWFCFFLINSQRHLEIHSLIQTRPPAKLPGKQKVSIIFHHTNTHNYQKSKRWHFLIFSIETSKFKSPYPQLLNYKNKNKTIRKIKIKAFINHNPPQKKIAFGGHGKRLKKGL